MFATINIILEAIEAQKGLWLAYEVHKFTAVGEKYLEMISQGNETFFIQYCVVKFGTT